MAATASNTPVISAARFVITIDGVDIATFSEVTGINSEVEPVEYISADKDGKILHTKQFGKTKPPRVSLKRGVDSSAAMWGWHQKVLDGDPAASQTCSLTLQDASGKGMVTYVLENAWPAKVEIANLKAGSSEVVTENVEMVCDTIFMQPPSPSS